ncbi:hypothetical protein D3C81_1043690 [compost metagenome]
MALGQHHLGAVLQRGALQCRELQLRELAGLRHAGLAVHLLGQGAVLAVHGRHVERLRRLRRIFLQRNAFTRLDHQGVAALVQPLRAQALEVGSGGLVDVGQRGAEAARVTGVHRAFGQRVGLAAEAADALDAADESSARAGLGACQFFGGRALLEQALDFLIDDLFDLGRILALLHRRHHHEVGPQLRGVGAGADVVHQLVLVLQALAQARGLGTAEHIGQQLQLVDVGGADLGHVPGAVDARLRHLVGHYFAGVGRALGHVHLRLCHGRAGRDAAEVLGGLFLGRGQIDVTGQHQHRVVRAVPGAEPGLDVVQRGGVEIVHRADHAVVVRVAHRIQRAVELFPHLAIGLVLALALLVLHHATLLVERGLVDRADQMAHAIRFHPQRHVQRGGRHVLEVIGAVGIGGAVLAGGTHLLEGLEVLAVVVLAALEHQVLEQMREAGTAGGLVLAADVIPDVDRNDRCLAIGMHHHPQAVGQGELLERDIDLAGRGRLGRQRVGRRKRAESSTESNSEQRGARAQGERHIRVLGHVGESRS